MLNKIATVLILLIFYAIVAFWTTVVFMKTIVTFIRRPSSFWYVKPRPEKPDALKREFRHGFLELNDKKIRLHYVEAGDSQKPLILFVHGFPEFWYTWRHQLRAFQNDYHVVALDMRGYSESSKPQSVREYSMENLVEDIRQTIRALGKGKCFLVAHDWGAAIAWRMTGQYPEMIEKLIIMNCPHPSAFQDHIKKSFKQLLRSWYMFFFQCPYLPEMVLRANDLESITRMLTEPPVGCINPNAFTEEDIEAWKYTFQRPGALTGPINYYRSVMSSMIMRGQTPDEHTKNLIKPPTLIIWGEKDAALGKEMANGSLLYCEKGALRLVEDASHFVQQDRPEICNQFIAAFLKE